MLEKELKKAIAAQPSAKDKDQAKKNVMNARAKVHAASQEEGKDGYQALLKDWKRSRRRN